MTAQEMQARIAELEGLLSKREVVKRSPEAGREGRQERKAERAALKAAAKARKIQFKEEAWKRAHLHSSMNRYRC